MAKTREELRNMALDIYKKKNPNTQFTKTDSLTATPPENMFISESDFLKGVQSDLGANKKATEHLKANATESNKQLGESRQLQKGSSGTTNMTLAQLDQYQAQQNAQRVAQLPPLKATTDDNGNKVIKDTPLKWDHYTQRIDNDLRVLQSNQKANPEGYSLDGLLQKKLQDYEGLTWAQIDEKTKSKSKEEKRLAWHLYKMQEKTQTNEVTDQTGGATEQTQKTTKEKKEVFQKFQDKYKQEKLNLNDKNKKLRPQTDD